MKFTICYIFGHTHQGLQRQTDITPQLHNPYTDLRALCYPPVTLVSTFSYFFTNIILRIAVRLAVSLLLSILRPFGQGSKHSQAGKWVLRFEFVSFFRLLISFKWHDCRTSDKRASKLVFVRSVYERLFCYCISNDLYFFLRFRSFFLAC